MDNTESRYIYHGRDKEKFNDRVESGTVLINELFNRHSRLLFIRLDLSYLQRLSQSITVDNALADIRHLYENLEWNPELSNGYLGFIRKLEYTAQKGLHHHTLFIFNADVRRGDIFIGQSLGNYWINTITKGRGIYHNCNQNPVQYDHYAVGRIDSHDAEKRQLLIDVVVKYLAKVEQEPENARGRKLFDMSRLQSSR